MSESKTKSKTRRARPLLDRLIDLETEYATRSELPPDQESPPARGEIFRAVCDGLSRWVPTAQHRYDESQVFLASGGAIALESSYDWLDESGSSIAGTTPQCRSPREVLACQRAQDSLFASAVSDCELPVSVRLLKTSRDDEGRIFGGQENYSADVARGPMLLAYRLSMILLFPLYVVYVALCLMLVFAGIVLFVSGRITFNLVCFRKPDTESLLDFPPWCLQWTARVLRVLHAPLAGLLWILAWATAFRRQRKYLTAFLVSRTVLCGSGYLDARGKYYLSGKAIAINSLLGMGGFMNERPIYLLGHWFQQLCSVWKSNASRNGIQDAFPAFKA